jgi:hypothetical protein
MGWDLANRFPLINRINGGGLSPDKLHQIVSRYNDWNLLAVEEKGFGVLLQEPLNGRNKEPEYIILLDEAGKYWLNQHKTATSKGRADSR